MNRAAKWAAANPGIALTIGGLVLFGYLRLAYMFFYNPLGVTPDDVGLGYEETLVTAVGLGLAIVVFALSFIVVGVILGTFRATLSARRKGSSEEGSSEEGSSNEGPSEEGSSVETPTPPSSVRMDASTLRKIIANAVEGVGAFLISILVFLLWLAHYEGTVARKGESSYAGTIVGVPLFQARADFASVSGAGGVPLPDVLAKRTCLLYLGQNGGITVLYDTTTRQPIRVPTSSVVISTRGGDMCRERTCKGVPSSLILPLSG